MLLGIKTIIFFTIWGVALSILLAEELVDITRFWSTVMSGSLVFFIGYVLTVVGFRTDNIDEIVQKIEQDRSEEDSDTRP